MKPGTSCRNQAPSWRTWSAIGSKSGERGPAFPHSSRKISTIDLLKAIDRPFRPLWISLDNVLNVIN